MICIPHKILFGWSAGHVPRMGDRRGN